MENTNNKGATCGCAHHKIIPATIMLVGFAMLADQVGFVPGLTGWAVSIGFVVYGCIKFFEGGCKCC